MTHLGIVTRLATPRPRHQDRVICGTMPAPPAQLPRRYRSSSLAAPWPTRLAAFIVACVTPVVVTGCTIQTGPPHEASLSSPAPMTDQGPATAEATVDVPAAVSGLNAHLAAARLEWRAGPNEFVGLTPEELQSRLGALVPPPSPPTTWRAPDDGSRPAAMRREVSRLRTGAGRSPSSASDRLSLAIPDVVDLRGAGTAIRDQDGCGSCWAFASIAGMESQIRRTNSSTSSELDLSEQRLVSCHEGSCGGYYVDQALEYLRTDGTVRESCNPYESTDDPALCPASCPGEQPLRIRAWGEVTPRTTVCSKEPYRRTEDWNLAVAQAIASRGALVAVMSVPYEFFFYDTGIYTYSGYFPNDPMGGCHAVALVGYSRPERFWIIKNSWGANWGEDGYARISWDDEYTHVGGLLYWIEVPQSAPTVRPSPTMYPYPPPTGTQPPLPPTIEPPTDTPEPPTPEPPTSPPPDTEEPPTQEPYPYP